jgi:hypothetical protein
MDSVVRAVEASIVSRLIGVGLVFLVATVSACGGGDIVTPVPPAQMTVVSGDNQSATAGQALPTPLTVAVTTAAGAPVVGDTVTWTIMTGTGSLSATSAVTDAAGHAAVNWTLGQETGTQSVLASVRWRPPGNKGFFGFGVAFSATSAPPPPPPQPAILHYDGTAWSVVLQGISTAPVLLNSVWGASSSAVFAVGQGQCGLELVLRYDGTSWTPPPQSCPPGGLNELSSVWGNSTSDVFAIARRPLPPFGGTSIQHFDGQSWTSQYSRGCSFCDPYLNAVWSSSPNYATAVGDSGFIVHYDGTAWTTQTSGTTQHLEALWGTGSGASAALFAIGASGTILSFDGTSWHTQTSGTTQALFGIWGTSATDVFAVGGGGTILHYDGTAWTTQNSGSTHTLRGVWGSSGSSVYAVGDASTILRYDGSSWTSQSAGASIELRGVWGSSPTNVFAVGRPKF